jgi:hypothetical protein
VPCLHSSEKVRKAEQLLDQVAGEDQELFKELKSMKQASKGEKGRSVNGELLAVTAPLAEPSEGMRRFYEGKDEHILMDRLENIESEERSLEAARGDLKAAIADLESAAPEGLAGGMEAAVKRSMIQTVTGGTTTGPGAGVLSQDSHGNESATVRGVTQIPDADLSPVPAGGGAAGERKG